MNAAPKSCNGCHESGRPLVVTPDGRELCLACVEASGDAAGVDADALALLRWLTSIADQERGSAN